MLVRIICTLFLMLGLMPPLACAQKRVALIIGNSAYKYTSLDFHGPRLA